MESKGNTYMALYFPKAMKNRGMNKLKNSFSHLPFFWIAKADSLYFSACSKKTWSAEERKR